MKGRIVFFMGLLLLGCASTQDVRILDNEMDKLYSQIKTLRKEIDSTKNDLSDLRAENQKVKTDLSLRLENLQSEVQALSTNVEEYKELLSRPSKETERFKEEMEGRLKTFEEKIKELEDRLKAPESKTLGSGARPIESEKLASAREGLSELKGISPGMGDLYRDAYETFYKGELEGARRKFEAFLKQYPNTELSNNAQFWIGETYYLKKDYEKAILEYEKAIVKYPEGDKIPAAIFKQALAFLELGDKTNARNLLKRVIEKYPLSDQAQLAKKKLETLK
jgi:tol-pal system protein YbgF